MEVIAFTLFFVEVQDRGLLVAFLFCIQQFIWIFMLIVYPLNHVVLQGVCLIMNPTLGVTCLSTRLKVS